MGGHWERWAPASGIVYVLLMVVGFVIGGIEEFDTDEEILAYYADSGDRAGAIVAFFVLTVGILFFLVFLGALRDRLRAVETEPKGLSALALGAGVVSAALFVTGVAVSVGVAFAAEEGDFVVDPNLARFVEDTGYLILVASIMVMSVTVAATSVLALRTEVLPTWLGWAGLVVAVILLVAIFFVPLFVLWLWILVVSIVLIGRTPTSHQETGGQQAT